MQLGTKRGTIRNTDEFDSKLLFFTITAIVLISYIIRMAVFTNYPDLDSQILAGVANFYTYYKLLWLMALVAVMLIIFVYRHYKFKLSINMNFVFISVGLICVTAIIATLLSKNTDIAIWGYYTRSNGLFAYVSLFLLIYILSNLKIENKHIKYLIHAVNIASIGFVIIGIFQFFGLDLMNSLQFKQIYVPKAFHNQIPFITILLIPYTNTPYFWAGSILAQYNYFGAYCSIIFPIITMFAVNEKKLISKLLFCLGSVMLFTGALLAQSLGSIIPTFLMVLLIPIMLLNKSNYKSFLVLGAAYGVIFAVLYKMTKGLILPEIAAIITKLGSPIKIIFAVLILLALYAAVIFARKFIKGNKFIIISTIIVVSLLAGTIGFVYMVNSAAGENMYMLSSRGYIWHYVNDLIKQSVLFGYGPDTLYYNFPQFNTDQAIYLPNTLVDKPHSMYLQVMFDIGIVGLLAFMSLLVIALLKFTKFIDIESENIKLTYVKGMILVIVAYMLQGIVNDNHMVIQPILYTLFGVGLALVNNVALFKKN